MANTCCPNCDLLLARAEQAESLLSQAVVSYLRLRRIVSRLLRREVEQG